MNDNGTPGHSNTFLESPMRTCERCEAEFNSDLEGEDIQDTLLCGGCIIEISQLIDTDEFPCTCDGDCEDGVWSFTACLPHACDNWLTEQREDEARVMAYGQRSDGGRI